MQVDMFCRKKKATDHISAPFLNSNRFRYEGSKTTQLLWEHMEKIFISISIMKLKGTKKAQQIQALGNKGDTWKDLSNKTELQNLNPSIIKGQ